MRIYVYAQIEAGVHYRPTDVFGEADIDVIVNRLMEQKDNDHIHGATMDGEEIELSAESVRKAILSATNSVRVAWKFKPHHHPSHRAIYVFEMA